MKVQDLFNIVSFSLTMLLMFYQFYVLQQTFMTELLASATKMIGLGDRAVLWYLDRFSGCKIVFTQYVNSRQSKTHELENFLLQIFKAKWEGYLDKEQTCKQYSCLYAFSPEMKISYL